MQNKIHEKFVSLFGEGGEVYASAGRINLIGEHTDYNGGYVFPGAIDKCLMAEIKRSIGHAIYSAFAAKPLKEEGRWQASTLYSQEMFLSEQV